MTPPSLMWLTNCPAHDCYFKTYLKTASADTIRKALDIVRTMQEKKSVIRRLESRLRRLERMKGETA